MMMVADANHVLDKAHNRADECFVTATTKCDHFTSFLIVFMRTESLHTLLVLVALCDSEHELFVWIKLLV